MLLRSLLLLASVLATVPVHAQFSAFVLPARFELKAKAGQKLAEVLEIGNDEAQAAEYRIRTADWSLRPDGGVDFRTDTLDAASCRPWAHLERHTIRISGKAKRRYRFEVHVPADAKDGLCRFALLIEPAQDAATVAPLGSIQLPIQGRIGIVVYVRVGDARPKLTFERLAIASVNGRDTPVAYFRNEGNAHGRPEGTLSGTDAAGKPVDLIVAPLPVLPGETRAIPVWPQDDADGRPIAVVFPVRVKGTVEWEGGRHPVDMTLAK